MRIKRAKCRTIYLPYDYTGPKMTVAEIEGNYYCIPGNSESFKVRNVKKDWGKEARWGKYIKL